MKAVVLAAGRGTRLGPLTAERAKPALTVGGRVHYRADQVRAALGDGAALGVEIAYFPEQELLGTAGALAPMAAFLAGADAFLVHYADVLTDHDLAGMVERHRRRRALLTLLVHERPGSNSVVTLDAEDRVTGFLERPTAEERSGADSPWVNSGVYVGGAEVTGLIPAGRADLARDVVPKALAFGRTFAERLAGYRCAVDSPERLAEAERALVEGRWRSALK